MVPRARNPRCHPGCTRKPLAHPQKCAMSKTHQKEKGELTMKKLLCLLTVFALLLSLCACSSNSAEAGSEPTESTKPEYIELTSENISEYLSYSWYNSGDILCITTKPRQPGQFFDCEISLWITFVDGSHHRSSISIPTDGEIGDGLESHKIRTYSRVDSIELIFACGKFYPA